MKLSDVLGEEVLEQVQEELKDEDVDLLVNSGDNEYVPRERLNDKNDQIESLKDQIDQREQQIKQLKEDTETSEKLQDKIEELEEQNEEQREEFEQKIQKNTKHSEVRIALAQENARNVDAVESLLDMDEIEVKDGAVEGLEEQIDELKESEDYLFDIEEEEGAEKSGGEFSGATETPEENPWEPGNLNLQKQSQIIQENKDLARHLIKEADKNPDKYDL